MNSLIEAAKEVGPFLKGIGDQLGIGLSFLWNILLRQAIVEGVMNSIAVVLIAWGLFKLRAQLNMFLEKMKSETIYTMHVLGIGMIMMSGSFLGLYHLRTALTAFVNPEFWAISEVVKWGGGRVDPNIFKNDK